MVALILAASLVAASPGWALEKVTVRLLWVHQAQFAGVYTAQDAGIYGKHGLEVRILPGGPAVDSLEELARGRCDFALAWLAAGIVRRAQGTPLIHLAQVTQRSAQLLVALADSGIRDISDLQGRRVGLWGGLLSLAPKALLQRQRITVQEVTQGTTVAPLVMRAVDAASAMRYNEYHQIYQAGIDFDGLVVFDLAAHGFNFPEDAIFTLERTWQQRPEVCRRFTAATLEGWQQAMARPDQALESVMRRVRKANLASNRSHQAWMLKTMSQLISPGAPDRPAQPGRLDPGAYGLVSRILLEHGLIPVQVPRQDLVKEAWRAAP